MKKLTVITVCYNSEKYIEQTIKSVIGQTYNNIEYIVVDGLSKDSTPQIIEKYRDYISIYLQCKDKNMYDAINKGLRASTGDYIAILNSDDFYWDNNVIQKIMDLIEKDNCSHDLYVMDDCKYYEPFGRVKKQRLFAAKFMEVLCSRTLTFIGHPTVFISRNVYDVIGEYDCENFRAAADYDYLLRALKLFRIKHVPICLMAFRVHPESITSSGQINEEQEEVLKKNGFLELPLIVKLFYYLKGWTKYISHNLLYNILFRLAKSSY